MIIKNYLDDDNIESALSKQFEEKKEKASALYEELQETNISLKTLKEHLEESEREIKEIEGSEEYKIGLAYEEAKAEKQKATYKGETLERVEQQKKAYRESFTKDSIGTGAGVGGVAGIATVKFTGAGAAVASTEAAAGIAASVGVSSAVVAGAAIIGGVAVVGAGVGYVYALQHAQDAADKKFKEQLDRINRIDREYTEAESRVLAANKIIDDISRPVVIHRQLAKEINRFKSEIDGLNNRKQNLEREHKNICKAKGFLEAQLDEIKRYKKEQQIERDIRQELEAKIRSELQSSRDEELIHNGKIPQSQLNDNYFQPAASSSQAGSSVNHNEDNNKWQDYVTARQQQAGPSNTQGIA
ncbi:hypothetical protein [Rickettsiales endosymbiont of Stachyamoeba lipophora]|uniref:hypothetical protein n=1 Tax=Rickettsiales endosymbiont of Stachyamoeba lipophora TaxID=2486578 RepID=UPI000F64B315|nr:hypothetical protein [Rickettsiales endosymbiont of Stachyamoeba lipophora]AZL16098.1 hypothetical protein EF513_06070 [Rickettsiales endosymbiont of Stachyamoeba lipophora]